MYPTEMPILCHSPVADPKKVTYLGRKETTEDGTKRHREKGIVKVTSYVNTISLPVSKLQVR